MILLFLGKILRKNDLENASSKMSNPSPFTPSIGFIKYGRKIPIITLIQFDPSVVVYLEEEINLLLDPDNSNPKIDTVALYYKSSHPKTPVQFEVNDIFVILKIKEWFVSLDKHFDRITIQTSEEVKDVLHKFERIPRDGKPELIKERKGNITVNELSNFIVESGFVQSSNHFMIDILNKAARPTEDPTEDKAEHWGVDKEKMIAYGKIPDFDEGAVRTTLAGGAAASGGAAKTTKEKYFVNWTANLDL